MIEQPIGNPQEQKLPERGPHGQCPWCGEDDPEKIGSCCMDAVAATEHDKTEVLPPATPQE